MGHWWSKSLVVCNISSWISETGVKLPGAHVCELVSWDCIWRAYSRLMGWPRSAWIKGVSQSIPIEAGDRKTASDRRKRFLLHPSKSYTVLLARCNTKQLTQRQCGPAGATPQLMSCVWKGGCPQLTSWVWMCDSSCPEANTKMIA